jgi:ABC-type transport system involved in multi-copper enzyme maturation permease subunit
MSAKAQRILKEVRSLCWPWCAVITAGLLPVLKNHFTQEGGPLRGVHYLIEPISFLGLVLGVPLLATLSLGSEFQHQTFQLLLSQPVSRLEIWREKMSVTVVAVLSASLVFCYVGRSALRQDPKLFVVAGTLVVSMTASAIFWTLVAKSTIGGLALNGVNSFIPLAFLTRPHWIPETVAMRSLAAAVFFGYSAVMLWLGRRSLVRFQVTGVLAGDDLLTAGQGMIPATLVEWLRCRSTSPSLNLTRKEFRLLRPVWLISLLAVPIWICLPMFGYTIERESVPVGLMLLAFIPLVAVLAGTMSLGEERTSGTHSWHMTLPVSALRQWFVKLLAALFTSFICAMLVPILLLSAGGSFSGSPSSLGTPDALRIWLPAVALLSFASFWCACAVKGTVHAAVWVFPAIIALFLAAQFGGWAGSELLLAPALSRLNFLFANLRFTNALANTRLFDNGAPPILFVLLLVPTLLIALNQSYRLFRKQLQDGVLLVLRRLMPLSISAFFCSFFLVASFALVAEAREEMWTMFKETHEAIEKIQPDVTTLDATHPLQLTAEDLFKAASVSERTRRWLRNSRITVAPDQPHPGPYCCVRNSWSIAFALNQPRPWYLANIHLPSGSTCTISFANGILGGTCK